ncbi:helix-turn-helix transcriptional regulator [Paenibacillus pasadenensis]|uniref:helix-turn-helix transcriptional regulator n=1 Tax=Paenibacillus pasadenensis TaxID=217090 RepID=UPI00041CD558|nr:LuxR C-terminal-related transcriptional regulator [Paenibacillus pasadenensis]
MRRREAGIRAIRKPLKPWCTVDDFDRNPADKQERERPGEQKEKTDLGPHAKHAEAIRKLAGEIEKLTLVKPHLFLYADEAGVVRHIQGESRLTSRLGEAGLRAGASLAREQAGRNAVALAMATGRLSVVEGLEHDKRAFGALSWICSPLRREARTSGYVALGSPPSGELAFRVPLLQQLARSVEGRTERAASDPDTVQKRLEEHRLTFREMQVAGDWLEGLTVEEIADRLGIAEQTVRTFIKKIYAKTGVNHKGEFFIRFLKR